MSSADVLSQTDLKQARASDPKSSAFVSANAGSGKTYVLVQRILRLLIEGTDPSRILALTYTTAAAANMSIRVFHELSEWVGLDDESLTLRIIKLDGSKITPERLKFARQLFARAVETPGGLKIQTIHAFCERVLHLFPFEANVPANFGIIDDQTQKQLMVSSRNKILSGISLDHPNELSNHFFELLNSIGENNFESILITAVKHIRDIRGIIESPKLLDRLYEKIKARLGLLTDETINDVWDRIYRDRLSAQVCSEIGDILMSSTPNDRKIGDSLGKSLRLIFGDEWKNTYLSAFFTKAMEARSDRTFVTKDIRDKHPYLFEILINERVRISDLFDTIKLIDAYNRTRALLFVTCQFLKEYDRQKSARGMLDFDDLILKTKQLLNQTSAQWVLYKLDNGIEHVLLDEAQDTSPDQWEILKLLTTEFYSGESSKRGIRTVFAVGDPKQSIYSFQGAEPKAFSIHKDFFKDKFNSLLSAKTDTARFFHDEKLTVSFRSTPEILHAVDLVFSVLENYDGLDHTSEPTIHTSQRMDASGMVEIWPPILTENKAPNKSWDAPLDEEERSSPAILLANQISNHVIGLISPNSKERIIAAITSQKAIFPGDILILVRKRGKLFEAIIRSLKEKGLPVSGADRLKLNEHIAVLDLIALGKSVITPEDDLNLATLLKSPLFGFTEDDLMLLAAERSGSLIDALFQNTNKEIFKRSSLLFQIFLDASKQEGPFSFYSFVLGACGGRRSFGERFGAEADDVVDEFLRVALEYENRKIPSLLRFIDDFVSADLTIKRDMDSGRNQIRVMTVHGAKGLEAPIVYLPDTFGHSVEKQKLDPIFNLGPNDDEYIPIWSPSQVTDSKSIAKLRDNAFVKEAEEHRRLLYVAMTRARDRLYIAGCHNKKNRPADCWYSIIDTALSTEMVDVLDGSAPVGSRRLQLKPFPAPDLIAQHDQTTEEIEAPQWLRTFPVLENSGMGPLKPSQALGFTASNTKLRENGLSTNSRQHGILIHKLLEYLPEVSETQRSLKARDYLKAQAPELDEKQHFEIIEDVSKTLNLLNISALFSKQSRAEIAIAGELKREGKPTRQVKGTIDRIAVTEDTVFIGDFKTTASPPAVAADVPDHIVAQLAVYGALVSAMFPGKKIRCFVIYTKGPEAVELPVEVLTRALSLIE